MIKLVLIAATMALLTLALSASARAEEASSTQELVDGAAAMVLYKDKCGGELSAGANEVVKVVIDKFGRDKVIVAIAALDEDHRTVGTEAFCRNVRKNYGKLLSLED
jgi:hypothetical protein